ncbi:hypothetical protein SNEBB_009006 [Seison nebaliae]|nr:hypothetical protein SNEBB_009006 [Seison nebaliae]
MRKYYYYIDHFGRLFLNETKHKNFTTSFKDVVFLEFFYRQFQSVNSKENNFNYLSKCGNELNYIKCDDLPFVGNHILNSSQLYDRLKWESDRCKWKWNEEKYKIKLSNYSHWLTMNQFYHSAIPFHLCDLFMNSINGRLYHSHEQSIFFRRFSKLWNLPPISLIDSKLAIKLFDDDMSFLSKLSDGSPSNSQFQNEKLEKLWKEYSDFKKE